MIEIYVTSVTIFMYHRPQFERDAHGLISCRCYIITHHPCLRDNCSFGCVPSFNIDNRAFIVGMLQWI